MKANPGLLSAGIRALLRLRTRECARPPSQKLYRGRRNDRALRPARLLHGRVSRPCLWRHDRIPPRLSRRSLGRRFRLPRPRPNHGRRRAGYPFRDGLAESGFQTPDAAWRRTHRQGATDCDRWAKGDHRSFLARGRRVVRCRRNDRCGISSENRQRCRPSVLKGAFHAALGGPFCTWDSTMGGSLPGCLVFRWYIRQLLGHRAAGDGHALAMESAMVEQHSQHLPHATDAMKVYGHVAARWLQVAENGASTHALEVVQRPFDASRFAIARM